MESRDIAFGVEGEEYLWTCPNCGVPGRCPIRRRTEILVMSWVRDDPTSGWDKGWDRRDTSTEDLAEIPPTLVCEGACGRVWHLDDPTETPLVARYTWVDKMTLLNTP